MNLKEMEYKKACDDEQNLAKEVRYRKFNRRKAEDRLYQKGLIIAKDFSLDAIHSAIIEARYANIDDIIGWLCFFGIDGKHYAYMLEYMLKLDYSGSLSIQEEVKIASQKTRDFLIKAKALYGKDVSKFMSKFYNMNVFEKRNAVKSTIDSFVEDRKWAQNNLRMLQFQSKHKTVEEYVMATMVHLAFCKSTACFYNLNDESDLQNNKQDEVSI